MKFMLDRKLTKRESVLLKIAFFTLVIAIHYSYIIRPLLNHNIRVKNALEIIEMENLYINNWGTKREELDHSISELENDLKNMKQFLPLNVGLVTVLQDLKTSADKNGVKISGIKQGFVEEKGYYRQIPLELTLEGDYLGIKGFMEEFKNLPWICLINQFQLGNGSEESQLIGSIRIAAIFANNSNEMPEANISTLPTLKHIPFEQN
ncbi:MAG TPA: type 4a pilus biogenesis protein PilO [Clostridia bacterium]|nr:type 4a pilus biogenesis protein PilO [Clostridia bacterium]